MGFINPVLYESEYLPILFDPGRNVSLEHFFSFKVLCGFLALLLTDNADANVLKDITNGSNPNCGSSGFAAVPGWDPVTGLGTPDYPKLLKLFMSLP